MSTATLDKPAAHPVAAPSPKDGFANGHVARAPLYTVADWERFEEGKLHRYQLREGRFIEMPGGTYEHSAIISDFHVALSLAVRAVGCETLPSDQRIYIANEHGLYADICVLCGKPQIGASNTLLNPVLVVEVLSPSTAADDRGDKFAKYRTRPTLSHYVLVEQHKPSVEHYERVPRSGEPIDGGDSGIWSLVAEHHDIAETLTVTLNGGVVLVPLADMYRRVEFTEIGTDVADVETDDADDESSAP